MTDDSQPIELREFEQVDVGPRTVLLRAAIESTAHASDARPTLVIYDGPEAHRIAPLPAPADPDGLIRAAYPAPRELLGDDSTFALELPSGAIVDLPAPSEGRARVGEREPPAEEPAPQAQDPESDATAPADDRRSDVHAQLAQLARSLASVERELTESRELMAATEAEGTATRQRAEELEGKLGATQQRIADTRTQMVALVAAVLEGNRTFVEMQTECARLLARSDELELGLQRSREELRLTSTERDELTRQVAAFDGVAIKARERATQAEQAHSQAIAQVQELQLASQELKERLSGATADLEVLAEARDKAEGDASELRAALRDVEASLELAEGRALQLVDERGSLSSRLETMFGELALLSATRADAESSLAVLQSEHQQATETNRAGHEQLQERVEELEAERYQLTARTDELNARLKTVLADANRARELEQELIAAREEADGLRAQLEVATDETTDKRARLQERLSELKRERASALVDSRERTAERERDAHELERVQSELTHARKELEVLQAELEAARLSQREATLVAVRVAAESQANAEAASDLWEAASESRPAGRLAGRR
ncbi:MAG: hypothetical protein JO156_15230 [Solirubrobacterales bacterium]|nr:hypothetical protein [Solirubrobacterales bacterium]